MRDRERENLRDHLANYPQLVAASVRPVLLPFHWAALARRRRRQVAAAGLAAAVSVSAVAAISPAINTVVTSAMAVAGFQHSSTSVSLT